jgi:hypothetical protein
LLQDGAVLVVGDCCHSGSSAEVYDPTKRLFEKSRVVLSGRSGRPLGPGPNGRPDALRCDRHQRRQVVGPRWCHVWRDLRDRYALTFSNSF